MFKRLGLVLIALLLLPMVTFAQSAPTTVAAMARYFPANTVFFAAVRTDENFLNMLDSLSQPALQIAQAAGTSTPSLSQSLNTLLGQVNTNLDTVMTWLGDHAAVGATAEAFQTSGGAPSGYYAVVEIANRAGAEAFLKSALPTDYSSGQQGDYTVFTGSSADLPHLAVSDNLMLIYPGSMDSPPASNAPGLDSNPDYQAAVSALSEGPYAALVYADPSQVAQHVPLDPTGQLNLDTAPLAVGITILDGKSFIIDSAQLPVKGAGVRVPESIDPNFAQYIPGNSSGAIHATNLTALYDSLMAFADAMNTVSQSPLPSAQVEQTLAGFGFNLKDELLSWTTGDYALFYRADLVDLITPLMTDQTPSLAGLGDRFDLGLVIQATDPAKAQTLASHLGTLLKQMVAGQTGITAKDEVIGGVNVTTFSLSIPVDAQDTLNTDLLLGATQNVFFLATRPAAQIIISGDGMLPTNPGYIEAQQHILPNPSFVWYADGQGLLVGTALTTIVPLALLGPAIGNVYSNVINQLQSTSEAPLPTLAPTPTQAAPAVDTAALAAQMESSLKAITSSSFSATTTKDGVTLLRFVVTSTH